MNPDRPLSHLGNLTNFGRKDIQLAAATNVDAGMGKPIKDRELTNSYLSS